jgi:hypothetical protein
MPASIKVLLNGIIDYAGTFPPASLPLQEALSSYISARRSAENWLLGRLVLPAGSLDEFERLVIAADLAGVAPLAVTAILGGDTSSQAQQLDAVVAFNKRLVGRAVIESVEFPPLSPSNIRQMRPRVSGALEAFFEVPVDAELERRVGAISLVGGSAKVRTGGVTPGAFPGPEDLARFIGGCDDAGIPFKATAGLHHAVRGSHRLTYDAGSPESPMYGFLNVCLAAALVRSGAALEEVADALGESSADAFQFREDTLVWRQRTIGTTALAETRQRLFRSFGSCAFREPIDELAALRLLP